MRPRSAFAPARAFLVLLSLVLALLAAGCGSGDRPLLPRSQTWAELRTVRRDVRVTLPGEPARAPYPRERLVDGEAVEVGPSGLAWLRRDGGATLLVRGPARLTVRSDGIEAHQGRVFVDTPSGVVEALLTPSGPLYLANVRASIDVNADATTEAYVLAGEVRTGSEARATAGERLIVRGKAGAAKAETVPALVWEDWTGGLATTDRAAEPAPYGVGTVGARRPGDQGSPRFPLAIQRLDVRVTIDGDFAVTEVDEIFFNTSSDRVEGIYRFRTPEGATLHRFGVDRDGVLVWGRVKEKKAAAAQYQANVYAGSREDPALLEWDAPGVYRARLYPIEPGGWRRVVVRYAEWLGRAGKKGERRLYVYPMAAEGAAGSMPIIEELTARIDLAKAEAKEVRVGMEGAREGDAIVVRAQDFTPRADLAVELFDDGQASLRGASARHVPDLDALPPQERAAAQRRASTEADYVLVPIRADDVPVAEGGLDLAIVLDTSAATDPGSLAIGRAATAALLAHLGKDDRVAIWAGDSALRQVAEGPEGGAKPGLAPMDEARRRRILTSLATIDRGGATDLGAMLAEAAASLDPARRGVVVYIGDGSPTVGELSLADLRDRLSKLPRPVRIFGLGVGDSADMAILKGIARGAFAERVGDANAAARAALRLLEHAERPAWLGARVDLGPEVERVFPRDLGAIVAGEGALVIGRLRTRKPPSRVTITAPGGADGTSVIEREMSLQVKPLDDKGDLRRRWAEGRLAQMLDEGVGRAAMVDLGSRYGIITPVTSLYVPTRREMSAEEVSELDARRRARREARHRDRTVQTRTSASNSNRNQDDDLDDLMEEHEVSHFAKLKPATDAPTAVATAMAAATPLDEPPAQAARKLGPTTAKPVPKLPTGMNEYNMPDTEVAAGEAKPTSGTTAGRAPAPEMAEPSDTAAYDADATKEVRTKALEQAQEFGMIGLLSADGEGEPVNPWHGKDTGVEIPLLEANGRFDQPYAPNPVAGGYIGGLDDSGSMTGAGFGDDISLATKAEAAQGQPSAGGDFWEGESGSGGERQKGRGPGVKGLSVVVHLGDVAHVALRCGAAAAAPFQERIGLWRERLARVAGNAAAVANVYRRALVDCEAPTFRERSKLLSMMLDFMPNVAARVTLWRVMFNDLGAADTLYRGLLARVRTTEEMRALHAALGLKTIDPGLLEKALAAAKSPVARAAKLRELVAVWPDDFALSLRLLDALEDAADDAGARSLGRSLRARPDADAALRTAVGELYLRLAARATTPAQKALDEAEARRAFGEIVEFSPDDPAARRRLGDLLRAHGWYGEAARQYETLARLSPDEPGVALLLAAAAEGLGKLEEAVRWTEKGGAAGDPDMLQSPAHTARALAATYLAWGRLSAREGGRAEEVKALLVRLGRVRAGEGRTVVPGSKGRGTRVTLTWAHPELHPALWSNALGAAMPAPEGDITLGISQVMLPDREGLAVEVRLDREAVDHAVRLGAEAVLTVVFDEGGEGDRVVRIPIRWGGGDAVKRFSIGGGEVREIGSGS